MEGPSKDSETNSVNLVWKATNWYRLLLTVKLFEGLDTVIIIMLISLWNQIKVYNDKT